LGCTVPPRQRERPHEGGRPGSIVQPAQRDGKDCVGAEQEDRRVQAQQLGEKAEFGDFEVAEDAREDAAEISGIGENGKQFAAVVTEDFSVKKTRRAAANDGDSSTARIETK
jgi:hypothetical protein